MDDPTLLAALAPTAGELLDRHLRSAKEWFPHELVSLRTGAAAVQVTAGVRSALVVNLLTEDGLPFYVTGLHRQFGAEAPWWDWTRRWAAEEQRHAIVIRDYLSATGAVDLVALERARMAHLSAASVPAAPTVAEALVYLSLQELATRVAHFNTGEQLSDPIGRTLMHRVAADENLHHLFYRDLVSAATQVDPSTTALAIDAQVRHFTMPGAAMASFAEHARAIAAAGIFGPAQLHAAVFVPLVLRSWHLDELADLTDEAARARDRCLAFVDRYGRIAERLSAATTEPPAGGGAPT